MELARVVVVCSPQPTTLVTFASERMNSQELVCSELEGGQQRRQHRFFGRQSVSVDASAPQFHALHLIKLADLSHQLYDQLQIRKEI